VMRAPARGAEARKAVSIARAWTVMSLRLSAWRKMTLLLCMTALGPTTEVSRTGAIDPSGTQPPPQSGRSKLA
jgi:hypothetical protein